MDLMELGSGCEEEDCGLASGFPEDCLNQECQWKEPVFGMIELVCVTIIYISLMLFGLLGNTLTILVVWLRPHMRSSTYLYLSSMAVSDLLILLLLPLDLYKLWRPIPWPLGDLACKVTMFLSECCTFCTILHITFLSLERYLAVCWPITAKTLVTRRRTRALIGCLWLAAVVSAAPVLVMVGVEEVGREELGTSEWREDRGWTRREGEQGGFMMGGRENGSGHMALMDEGLEGMKWREKAEMGWSESVRELKRLGEKGERQPGVGERDERKQADVGGGQEESKMEDERELQNKNDRHEGGGWEEDKGGRTEESDETECRCTDYAIASGLLATMMILSNLYFLVPLCILGLVYSLIGRTLWLRPQSSRRDQSHRHTVKMLGVIVLAFVLCWLPFHVGRTIFSFSMDTGIYGQEAYTDTNAPLEMNTLSDGIGRDRNTHAVSEPITYLDSDRDMHFKTPFRNGKMTHTDRDTATHNNTHKTTRILTQLSHLPTVRATYTDAHTSISMLSRTPIINSQNNTHPILTNTQHTQTTYTVMPTSLYTVNTHNSTPFNNTYTHPDPHLVFLYYLSQYINLVSSVLFYLSAAINPLLYNLMSARYRHAVYSLMHTHTHTQSHRLHTLTARPSTTTL